MNCKQHIAEIGPLLSGAGIREVVICPGSRNAPLTQLFTSDGRFRCHSIVDERSAAYLALGMASQLHRPVAVVTTSGTAVLNLAPAIAEAHFQQIPLIILTADRPREEIPQFDNQVIDQKGPFRNNSKAFFQLPALIRNREDLISLSKEISELFVSSQTIPRGPIHINIPLEEPLYEPLPQPVLTLSPREDPQASSRPTGILPERIPPERKVLVIAGMGTQREELQDELGSLLQKRQAVVVAENIANMPQEGFIANPELILAGISEEERKRLAPEVIILFGGQVVSKSLKDFIQNLENAEIRVVDQDPLQTIATMLAINDPGDTEDTDFENSYFSDWRLMEKRTLDKAGRFLENAGFSNLKSMGMILGAVPEGSVVHLGNSGTIRYSQLMPLRTDLSYFSNRGTSGIDGSVSAAVGAAKVSGNLHILILGDLSFVYDSNALWNRDFPDNLRIIVLNDSGGGIFRLLDGPGRMDFFEEFSVTHHPVSLELLSQAFGRRYSRAGNQEELETALQRFFAEGRAHSILEVDTTGSENSAIFKDFIKSIS